MALPFTLGRLGAFGTLVMPMDLSRATVMTVSAIEIIVVEKLVLFAFLHLFHLAIFVLEGLVHVPRPADDGAELDVVLLRNPTPAVTAGLQRRDFIESLARGRRQRIRDEQPAIPQARIIALHFQGRDRHARFARNGRQNALPPIRPRPPRIEVARRSFQDDNVIRIHHRGAEGQERRQNQTQLFHIINS